MNPKITIGSRVEDLKGFKGTVQYIGSVGSTEGEWLGIEWDDASRGKHNGVHEGKIYFETKEPSCGSFVRPSKLNPGLGVREAVEERYGSKGADQEFRPEDIKQIQKEMKASLFEVVGMDKVRQTQRNYGKLNVISLRNMRVQHLDGDLKEFISNVQSLDLGENLLHSWDDILFMIKDLSHLKHLVVSENKLSLPQKFVDSIPSVKHLVLGRMNYEWLDIHSIIRLFPSLENLQIHGNAISNIDTSPEEMAAILPNLRELDMNLNPIVKWKNIAKFSKCPSLEALMINDCQLTEVEEIGNGFLLLKKIELNCNNVQNWRTLSHLEELPSLIELRLRSDELKDPVPKKQPKNRRLSPRQTVIAMFSRIKVLNGTEIDRQERFGAEIDYLKMFGLDYFEAKSESSSLLPIPRYDALVALHGEPDEAELKGTDSDMDGMFLHLNLKRNEESINKKIPKTMTVKALKLLSKKLFKAPNLKDLELSYTTEKSKDVTIPLDDDLREITYFGVINGDTMNLLFMKSEARLINSLQQRKIRFGVQGSQVKVLNDPTEFYEELKHRSKAAKSRIVLSALYLGTGKKERELLDSLLDNPFKPRTRILLDYFRGTRINSSDGLSSIRFLLPLLESSPSSTSISLYQTPALQGFLKRLSPQRYNETIGLQHIKAYIFDNTLVISGANLSSDYFTNRQDRYIVIENCEELADFFEDLIELIGDFSFELKGNGDVEWSNRSPFIEDNTASYISEFKNRLLDFLSSKEKLESPGQECDTQIYPSVQLGNIGITDDSEFTSDVLRSGSDTGYMRFGTGYFNLTQEYMNIILKETGMTQYDILMAHPTANGFFNAKGPAGGIPSAYTLIASQFYNRIVTHSQKDRIRMFEYQRPQWTFHGKGLWYSPSKDEDPIFTLIGSPNFGYRSVHRDIEAQLAILTRNAKLRRGLNAEAQHIFSPSNVVTQQTFKRPERSVPLWVKGIVRLARNFF